MISSKWLAVGVACGFTGQVSAVDVKEVQAWLERPAIGGDLALEQIQNVTERQVIQLRTSKSKEDWERFARDLRQEVLEDVVYRGEAERWRQGRTQVEWLETLEVSPEYRIRKLRYQAVPGFWIPALLYEPTRLKGKMPVVLNVNGHDGKGKAAEYKQIRCITLAKQGVLALNTEWIGMGQLHLPDNLHYRMNQLDLCGTSGLAPFYLAMKRALDVLLNHPNADARRVGVTGLSGGGWQTIVISALDERVTLANPVAGYSSYRTRARHTSDLGDSEQTPTDLAAIADYTHLTALLAPRPALLTFNAKDNCCFASDHALPPLLEAATPVYKLYGAENLLRSHVNHEPGDHNYGEDNRKAFYDLIGDHFFADNVSFSRDDKFKREELKTPEELTVPLKPGNATLHSLALKLAADLPRATKLPTQVSRAEQWQIAQREVLEERIQSRPYRVTTLKESQSNLIDVKARLRRFTIRQSWTIPGVEFEPVFSKATAIVIHDEGRAHAAEAVTELIRQQYRVIAIDLFYFGESKIKSRDFLYALLLSSIGERPLGVQSSQLNAVAKWAQREHRPAPVTVHAFGPRSSLIGLVAAASDPRHIQELDLHQSLGSLKDILRNNWAVNEKPELFCFGLLESFDIRQLTAMVAPRPVRFHSPTPGTEEALRGLSAWYALLGREHDPL